MTNLFKDFHKLCDSESQPQAQDFVLSFENAALKEQVAQLKSSVQHEADCVDSAAAEINRQASENDKLKETIAQQAEAIRLKDEALKLAAETFAGYAIHHGNKDVPDLDKVVKNVSISNLMNSALKAQPSPDILQARDEKVAEACANLVNRFISGDGILNDTWVHEIEEALRTNEWRKYL